MTNRWRRRWWGGGWSAGRRSRRSPGGRRNPRATLVWMVDHALDHRRRLLDWSCSDGYCRRLRHGGRRGLAGEVGLGETGKEPRKPEGARHAPERGQAHEPDRAVTGLLWLPAHENLNRLEVATRRASVWATCGAMGWGSAGVPPAALLSLPAGAGRTRRSPGAAREPKGTRRRPGSAGARGGRRGS